MTIFATTDSSATCMVVMYVLTSHDNIVYSFLYIGKVMIFHSYGEHGD